MKKYWPLIFLLVFAARLGFSTLSYNPDLNNNLNWVNSIEKSGFTGFYERDFYPYSQANYPPLITSIYYYFDHAYQQLHGNSYATRATLNKLPTTITESFAISLSLTLSPLIFIVYLVNPAIVYNSVLWGQTEGMVAALVFLAIYVLIKKKQPLIASATILLALLVKQSTIIYVPLFAYLVCKQIGLKKTLILGVGLTLAYTLFFVPFYSGDFVANAFKFLVDSSQGQSHEASVNALNFWYMIGLNKVPDSLGTLISYRNIGIIISLSFIGLIIYTARKRLTFETVLTAAGLTNYAVCLFLTRIHERHLLPTLVLLLPLAVKSKTNFAVYSIVSTIYFVNLYLIWHEKFAGFDKTILAVLSGILIACFFYFLIKLLRIRKDLEPKT